MRDLDALEPVQKVNFLLELDFNDPARSTALIEAQEQKILGVLSRKLGNWYSFEVIRQRLLSKGISVKNFEETLQGMVKKQLIEKSEIGQYYKKVF